MLAGLLHADRTSDNVGNVAGDACNGNFNMRGSCEAVHPIILTSSVGREKQQVVPTDNGMGVMSHWV